MILQTQASHTRLPRAPKSPSPGGSQTHRRESSPQAGATRAVSSPGGSQTHRHESSPRSPLPIPLLRSARSATGQRTLAFRRRRSAARCPGTRSPPWTKLVCPLASAALQVSRGHKIPVRSTSRSTPRQISSPGGAACSPAGASLLPRPHEPVDPQARWPRVGRRSLEAPRSSLPVSPRSTRGKSRGPPGAVDRGRGIRVVSAVAYLED